MIDLEERVAAKGVWLYDGIVPRLIEIRSRPARFAGSRFKESEEDTAIPETADGFFLDENTPIPDTPDGLVYYVGATAGGQFNTLEDAKRWADAQPWGSCEMGLRVRFSAPRMKLSTDHLQTPGCRHYAGGNNYCCSGSDSVGRF